jgi:hypothetical protein
MVAPGFYLGAMTMTAGTCSEECRRCKGLGTIVIAQQPRQPFGPERVPAGEAHEP